MIQRGVGYPSAVNHSPTYGSFLESVALFLGQNKRKNFWSLYKSFQPPESTKKYILGYNGYSVCLIKATCRTLSLFIKYILNKYCLKFQVRSIT